MATPAEAIEQTVTDNLSEVTIGGEHVKAIPLPELIAADKHLGSKDQARSPFPLRMNKVSPPGAA